MPLDASPTLRAARDAYLTANGFDTKTYDDPTFTLPVLGRPVTFPNPPARRRVIARHDLHHTLTGFGTDYVGEAEVSAWELRAGCPTPFLVAINLGAVALGLFLAPSRVWRAFRAAKGQRTLYLDARPLDELLECSLDDVRRDLAIPVGGAVV